METVYLYLIENQVFGWSFTRNSPEEIEVQLEADHPLFVSKPKTFIYQDGKVIKSDEIELQLAKAKKDAELNRACQETILAGFYHVINGVEYWFSYDYEAQQNFTDAKAVFDDGLLDEIMWTVKQDGQYTRIPVTREIYNELKISVMLHKTSIISKYRDFLMPIVMDAQTVEEVQSISW